MALGHQGAEIVDSDSILTCDTDGGVGVSNPTIAKNSEKTHAMKALEIVDSSSAGKDHVKLATDNAEVFARNKLVESDGKCAAETAGINMRFLLKTTDTSTVVGDRIIGAGDGFVKGVSEPNAFTANPTAANLNSILAWSRGKGRITHIYTSGSKKYCVTNFRS